MDRIFVVGCPRSGTTLVQAMLARHPSIFSLRETFFFESLLGGSNVRWGDREARAHRRWYHRAGAAQSWGRRRLLELERIYRPEKPPRRAPMGWRPCALRYVAMLDAAADRRDCRAWVEKTPAHLLFLDEILEVAPDARIVHVLRRGRDVVASVMDADLRLQTAGFRGSIAQWAARWNRAVQLHLLRLGDPRHHLVCLEDLVANPEVEWRRLCDFLGLDKALPLLAQPVNDVADSQSEPWKGNAIAGVIERPSDKAQALFGPRILDWLQTHLIDYDAVRQLVHRDRESVSEPPHELQRVRALRAAKKNGAS